jgi:hypothetical protein
MPPQDRRPHDECWYYLLGGGLELEIEDWDLGIEPGDRGRGTITTQPGRSQTGGSEARRLQVEYILV